MQLNLGPLNEFVEYIARDSGAEYPSDFYGATYIYEPRNDQIVMVVAGSGESVIVPIFDIEVKLPLVDNSVNRMKLTNYLSLVVLQKILESISKHPELQECLHNDCMEIPVRCDVDFSEYESVLCARIELGILLGIDSKVKE